MIIRRIYYYVCRRDRTNLSGALYHYNKNQSALCKTLTNLSNNYFFYTYLIVPTAVKREK